MDSSRGDALPADLLADIPGQQPRRQPRVLRLLAGHLGRGLDRQPVQLGRGRPVVQAADRLRRDPHRVDLVQPAPAALDRADDLVHVDRLAVPVALPDLHATRRAPRWTGMGNRHRSLLASLLRMARLRRERDEARGPGRGRAPCSPAVPRGRSLPRTGARGALAGLRARGHSAIVRRSLLAVASQAGQATMAQCCPAALACARPGRLSFPLTAAGQSRIHTGFPLTPASLDGPRNQLRAPPYVGGPAIPSTRCRADLSCGPSLSRVPSNVGVVMRPARPDQ
jgi:hypothetical protein